MECACLQNVFQDLKYVVDEVAHCNVTCQISQSEYSCGGLNALSVYVASKLKKLVLILMVGLTMSQNISNCQKYN